ncbi:hypothetical protein C4K39_0844 [Pseudomonas sessilinigenes]|nr:hypothetical protein C4K39_0844 [Pseudomonas sessilinigenes]
MPLAATIHFMTNPSMNNQVQSSSSYKVHNPIALNKLRIPVRDAG